MYCNWLLGSTMLCEDAESSLADGTLTPFQVDARADSITYCIYHLQCAVFAADYSLVGAVTVYAPVLRNRACHARDNIRCTRRWIS
jgi:hypothetical protein